MKYTHLAIGGTFDHLHKGHEAFLKKAFQLGSKVSIGLSTDTFIQSKKFSSQILSYKKRKKELEDYLRVKKYFQKARIFSLDDIYGIAIKDKTVDGLLATSDTFENAEKINQKRIENGFSPLEIEKIDFVMAHDKTPIQSEKIREGKIDRHGFTFKSLFDYTTLYLPRTLREELRKPLGEVILQGENTEEDTTKKAIVLIQKENTPLVIAVGDIIVNYLRQNSSPADIEIIDNKTRRTELVVNHVFSTPSVLNEQGTVNSKAVSMISAAIKEFQETGEKQHILISGEEDLLALPAILLSPLGSIILYGQWNLGIVMIKVSEEIKQTSKILISQFSTSGVE